MPKWDSLRPLPDHVVAPLLRALACIPRTADTRLLLVKRTDGRPSGWDHENDYDVVFRGQDGAERIGPEKEAERIVRDIRRQRSTA